MKKSHDPSTWNEEDWNNYNKPSQEWNAIEWANVYRLYDATQMWELDESLDFDEFKQRVQNDSEFANLHKVKPGMDDPNYNPLS